MIIDSNYSSSSNIALPENIVLSVRLKSKILRQGECYCFSPLFFLNTDQNQPFNKPLFIVKIEGGEDTSIIRVVSRLISKVGKI